MSSATESTISVHIADKVAILTLDRPQTLNALTPSDYDKLSNSLREIDSRDDVLVTILQGNGQWFCSGTDVRSKKPTDDVKTGNLRETFRTSVTSTTIDVGQAVDNKLLTSIPIERLTLFHAAALLA